MRNTTSHKQEMINLFGETKTLAKIASNKLASRADPHSGLSDEWNIEYKLYKDTGGEAEEYLRREAMSADTELDKASATEVQDQINSAASCMDLGDVSGASGSGAPHMQALIKIEPVGEVVAEAGGLPHMGTLSKLQTDLKKEMRAMADRVTTLKEIFEETKSGKYLQQIHEDATKLIPRASAIFRKIEKVHIECIKDEAVLLAIAKSMEEFMVDFEELVDWHLKLCPKRVAKKSKKA